MLPEWLPDPRPLELLLEHTNQPDFEMLGNWLLLEADDHTYVRLAAWYRRIARSRDRLYERLYGDS